MCGIVGIVGREPVAAKLCDALMVLQHRGQDAAGIATLDGDRIFLRRAAGLVRDVFKGDEHWQNIKVEGGLTYTWPVSSTYVQNPPYFEGMTMEPKPPRNISSNSVTAPIPTELFLSIALASSSKR